MHYLPVTYNVYPSRHSVASVFFTSHFFAPVGHNVHYEFNRLYVDKQVYGVGF